MLLSALQRKSFKKGEEASSSKGLLLAAHGTLESILNQPSAYLQQALWLTFKPLIIAILKVKTKLYCSVS